MNSKQVTWRGYLGLGLILLAVGITPDTETPFWLYLLIAFVCLLVGAALVAEDSAKNGL